VGLHGRRRGARARAAPAEPNRRYVLKADPSRQWRLLDLQAIDTRLDQITHAKAHLPEHAQVVELQGRAAALDSDVVRAQTALGDVQREVAKAEADVQLVRDRAARDQSRLDSGVGTAKDLQALQHEMQSLSRRQSELEAVVAEVARLEAERAELATRLAETTSARDAAVARLDAEAGQVGGPRADIVAGVGEDLVALYEKVRSHSGGLGAAPLRQRRCGGCQLELNTVDMNRIKAAPEDEVLRCEECRRILVRTAESGI
jgi:predicted  nucleic acid-binding Zn-ribbon protein